MTRFQTTNLQILEAPSLTSNTPNNTPTLNNLNINGAHASKNKNTKSLQMTTINTNLCVKITHLFSNTSKNYHMRKQNLTTNPYVNFHFQWLANSPNKTHQKTQIQTSILFPLLDLRRPYRAAKNSNSLSSMSPLLLVYKTLPALSGIWVQTVNLCVLKVSKPWVGIPRMTKSGLFFKKTYWTY